MFRKSDPTTSVVYNKKKSFLVHVECPSQVSCGSITCLFFFLGHKRSELLLPIFPKEHFKWQKGIDLNEAHRG